MKKSFIIITVISGIIFLTSFKMTSDFSQANVEQQQGVFIFIMSKPSSKYDYLGTVKPKWVEASTKPEQALNTLLKKAKENYPQCNGIIFTSADMQTADAIKFKE